MGLSSPLSIILSGLIFAYQQEPSKNKQFFLVLHHYPLLQKQPMCCINCLIYEQKWRKIMYMYFLYNIIPIYPHPSTGIPAWDRILYNFVSFLAYHCILFFCKSLKSGLFLAISIESLHP